MKSVYSGLSVSLLIVCAVFVLGTLKGLAEPMDFWFLVLFVVSGIGLYYSIRAHLSTYSAKRYSR